MGSEELIARLRDLGLHTPTLAADLIERQAALLVEAEQVLRMVAEQPTIQEVMTGASGSVDAEWMKASVERRIEMMGERKRANDDRIIRARAVVAKLSPSPTNHQPEIG